MTKFGLGYASGKNKAPTFLDIINNLGQSSGAQMVCDIGSVSSYSGGSSTDLIDLTGNGNGWQRHLNQVGNPTAPISDVFNGTVGGLSENEYMLSQHSQLQEDKEFLPIKGNFAGGATYANGFQTSGAEFTIAALVYATLGTPFKIFGTSHAIAGQWGKGMLFFREGSTGHIESSVGPSARQLGLFAYRNDSGGNSGRVNSSLTVFDDAWNFVAVSVSATGSVRFRVNGSPATFTGVSWGAGDSSTTSDFPTYNCTATLLDTGTKRNGPIAVWNRALDGTELAALYSAVKQYRYPSLT